MVTLMASGSSWSATLAFPFSVNTGPASRPSSATCSLFVPSEACTEPSWPIDVTRIEEPSMYWAKRVVWSSSRSSTDTYWPVLAVRTVAATSCFWASPPNAAAVS